MFEGKTNFFVREPFLYFLKFAFHCKKKAGVYRFLNICMCICLHTATYMPFIRAHTDGWVLMFSFRAVERNIVYSTHTPGSVHACMRPWLNETGNAYKHILVYIRAVAHWWHKPTLTVALAFAYTTFSEHILCVTNKIVANKSIGFQPQCALLIDVISLFFLCYCCCFSSSLSPSMEYVYEIMYTTTAAAANGMIWYMYCIYIDTQSNNRRQ